LGALEAECERLRAQVDNLRNGLAHWKTIAETESWPYEWDVATVIKSERDAALVEVERLSAELTVTQDLLRDAPMGFEDYTYETWYASVSDYLETLETSGQDAAGS
jgi:hypothetical protein